MRIGIDIMGGDFAPKVTILGAILAYEELSSETELVLIGNKDQIKTLLRENNQPLNGFDIIHAEDTIRNGENPAKAFARKTSSSINVGYKLLSEKKIDGFASAGSTGAMMVGAMYTIKSIPGIIRPVITAAVPQLNGKYSILLDVGINPDCKPDVLFQYGLIGSIYAEKVYNIENPKVGLINIGEEEEKGTLVVKSAYDLMKNTNKYNFIGNVEGNELFDNKADVLVCDGFVGNIILKQAEAFYKVMQKKKLTDDYFDRFNYKNIGGTPLLGVNGNVIIGHGISDDIAIKNMIKHTKSVIEANLAQKIKEAFQ